MRGPSQRGFTLTELLAATWLTVTIGALCLGVLAAMARASVSHPQGADQQQRLRAAFDQLTELAGRAGAGMRGTGRNAARPLVPALYPQRRGVPSPDPDTGAFADRVTFLSGAATASLAPLASPVAAPSSPVWIDLASCAPGRQSCGFGVGDYALLADARARGEWFKVAATSGGRLDHLPARLCSTYRTEDDAVLVAVEVKTLAFDAGLRQLRLATPGSDQPWLDDVAAFEVTWFGDPRPPRTPVPAPGEASCIIGADGSPQLPELGRQGGSWVPLTLATLGDGPWCGDPPWRYDADLLRVRRLRFRVELFSPAGLSVASPAGAGARAIEFEIAPTNLVRGG
jgi:hypothetical protein